jgi:hypothetical protein
VNAPFVPFRSIACAALRTQLTAIPSSFLCGQKRRSLFRVPAVQRPEELFRGDRVVDPDHRPPHERRNTVLAHVRPVSLHPDVTASGPYTSFPFDCDARFGLRPVESPEPAGAEPELRGPAPAPEDFLGLVSS